VSADDPLASVRRVHMVGIGGAGMSALARLYLQKGLRVSGSDRAASGALDDLASLGAEVYAGNDPERASDADLVVYSSAVPQSDPELLAAAAAGIRSIKHAQALGELFNTRRGIAIAGTHGKTTTTSMAALILERAGLDPTFQVGGELIDLGTSAKWGGGQWMVVEADEFDRRFLEYSPEIAVINNVEPDHFEYYVTYERMREAFGEFVDRLRPGGTVVAWGDDTRLAGLLDERRPERVVRFGVARDPDDARRLDVLARDVTLTADGARFVVEHAASGERAAVTLAVPGEHNVHNALAAMTAVHLAGVSLEGAAQTLAGFHGARRRFQLLADAGGIRVYDDYAHHPTAVRVVLEAARRLVPPGGRLWAVFQPHLRTRTEELFDEFTTAFAEADVVLLSDVYSPRAREPEGTYRGSAELVASLRHPNARHIPDLEDIRYLLTDELRSGDVVMVMGAGTIERLVPQIAEDVRARG
jgi:UDP-N-acetylmuramate--alanine ligase